MNKRRTNILLSWCGLWAIIFFIGSCSLWSGYPEELQSALDRAGPNRKELVKVLTYYSQDPADSLKLRAAEYLIAHMPGHSFKERPEVFSSVFDSAAKYSNYGKRAHFFRNAMNRIKKAYSSDFYNDSLIVDLHYLTADFLINNINLAFKAYYRIPLQVRPNLNKFFNYILPYRASNEPLEFGNRKKQFEKYQWVYHKLHSGQSVPNVIDDIIDSTNVTFCFETDYPGIFSAGQIDKVKFGNCDDATNYMVNLFRAIGIPASIDFTPHWGNVPDHGHSWLAINTKDSLLTFDAFSKEKIAKVDNRESLPKVYRYTYRNRHAFPNFTKDVTNIYKPSNRIEITGLWSKNLTSKKVYLTVFDKRYGWYPVARASKRNNGRYIFPNIAQNVVFLVGYYNNTHRLHAINYPFIVHKKQKLTYLNPNNGKVDSAIIRRKFPPYFYRRKYVRLKRVQAINDLKFQGSNSPTFDNPVTILDFKNFRSTHFKSIPLSYPGKYKFYRLIGPDTSAVYIAELRVKAKKPYKKTFSSSRSHKFKNLLLDNNPLTWQGGTRLCAKYIFSQPAKIDTIQLQARNDDNDINVGDIYKLRYWNQGWKSLDINRAKDTLLMYHNMPQQALYWLQNLSQGKEEEVFTLTPEGRQHWPGVSGNRDSLINNIISSNRHN